MDQVRQVMRYHHYAYRTEKTYSDWILRYIKFFSAKYHPKDMGKKEHFSNVSQSEYLSGGVFADVGQSVDGHKVQRVAGKQAGY